MPPQTRPQQHARKMHIAHGRHHHRRSAQDSRIIPPFSALQNYPYYGAPGVVGFVPPGAEFQSRLPAGPYLYQTISIPFPMQSMAGMASYLDITSASVNDVTFLPMFPRNFTILIFLVFSCNVLNHRIHNVIALHCRPTAAIGSLLQIFTYRSQANGDMIMVD